MAGYRPDEAIVFAQAANGILLPVIAVFLLVVVNRSALLGQYTNRLTANLLGVMVVATAAGIGIYKLIEVFRG
jgi:Mn2+/Fe2+ NRAMP family transporter